MASSRKGEAPRPTQSRKASPPPEPSTEEFARFEELTRRLVNVPKPEIDEARQAEKKS